MEPLDPALARTTIGTAAKGPNDVQPDMEPSPQLGDENRPEDADVIELEVRESKGRVVAEPAPQATIARTAGGVAASVWISAIRTGVDLTSGVASWAADTAIGRWINEAASGALDAVARELRPDLDQVGTLAEHTVGQVISVVVPVVVRSLEPDEVIEAIDINAILAAVDVDALLDRVDVDRLLARVDVNALLDRVDVDGLMQRADVDALVARVDVDALMQRVDIEALLERVDVNAVAKRAKVGELVAESTGDVAGSALDLGRRQAVGIDTVLMGTINRVLGREPGSMPLGPPLLTDAADVEDETS